MHNRIASLLILLTVGCSEPTNFRETELDGNKERLNGDAEGNPVSGDITQNGDSNQKKVVKIKDKVVINGKGEDDPIGAPPVFDPVTQTYSLNIATSFTKPLTNVVIVVDNSFSMSAIQAKVAAAVNKLIEQATAEDLNINLHLYTTTDLLVNGPAPLGIASANLPTSLTVNLQQKAFGTNGAKGNSSFGNRSFFEIINGIKTPLANLQSIRPDQKFWVSDEVVLGSSQFSGGENGVLKFREGMTALDIKPLVDSAVANISQLGTAGSDSEQPIGAIYRFSRNLPANSSDRYAFWIITNEDDSTRKSLVLSQESEIAPQASVTMYGRIQATTISLEYETLIAPVVTDGVVVTPATWVRANFSRTLTDCKANALCNGVSDLNKTLTCSAAQSTFINDLLVVNANNRKIDSAKCTARSAIANKATLVSTDLTATCASIYPATGKSFTDSLADLMQVERIDSVGCLKGSITPFILKTTKRIAEVPNATDSYAIGSEEIGDIALQNLIEKVGPKGYTVGLIANEGADTCNQGTFSDAVRLRAFMQKTPSPLLKTSVCQDDYWTVVGKGIKDFVTTAPQLVYQFNVDPTKIQSATVVSASGAETPLSELDYTVNAGSISIKAGMVGIGDTVKFVTIVE